MCTIHWDKNLNFCPKLQFWKKKKNWIFALKNQYELSKQKKGKNCKNWPNLPRFLNSFVFSCQGIFQKFWTCLNFLGKRGVFFSRVAGKVKKIQKCAAAIVVVVTTTLASSGWKSWGKLGWWWMTYLPSRIFHFRPKILVDCKSALNQKFYF